MALKDWTKPKLMNNNPEIIQYVKNYNGYDGSPSLFVYKQDYDFSVWGNKPSEWRVEVIKAGSFGKQLGDYKTKEKALSKAKQYMRTH